MNVYFVIFEHHGERVYHIKACFLSLDAAKKYHREFLEEYEHGDLVDVEDYYMGLKRLYECYFKYPEKYYSKCCLTIAEHPLSDQDLDDQDLDNQDEACLGQRMC